MKNSTWNTENNYLRTLNNKQNQADQEGEPKLGETIHLGVNFSFVLQIFHGFASAYA